MADVLNNCLFHHLQNEFCLENNFNQTFEAFLCLYVTQKALQFPLFFIFYIIFVIYICHIVDLTLFMVKFEKGLETARNSETIWKLIENSSMKIRGSKEVYSKQFR